MESKGKHAMTVKCPNESANDILCENKNSDNILSIITNRVSFDALNTLHVGRKISYFFKVKAFWSVMFNIFCLMMGPESAI